MFDSIRKTYRLIARHERGGFLILLLIMIVEAMMEMAGVALIPLYVTAIAYPEVVLEHERLAGVLSEAQVEALTRERLILWGGIVMALFFAAKTAYTIIGTYWKARFANNRARKLGLRLFSAYLRTPWIFHLENNTSELLRNINQDCQLLAMHNLLPMLRVISNVLILIGITAVLFYALELRILLWIAGFLAVGIVATILLQNWLKRLGAEAQHQRGRLVRSVTEGLTGVKEIKILDRSRFFIQRLDAALTRIFNIQRTMWQLQSAIPNVIELTGIVGLVGVTIMLVMESAPTESVVATLTVFAVALQRMKGSLRGAVDQYALSRHHAPSLDVVYNGLMQLEGALEATGDAHEELPFTDSITLDGLAFRFPGADRESLSDVSLVLRRGEAVGIVGQTGAGKSTLLNLLLSVVYPERGEIRVDGVPIADRIGAWRRHLGYVPQELFLIDGTIADNIALGLAPADIDQARLERAAAAAELTPLLARLERGLDTVVGERGIRLSGGERQRVAIARALYNEPDILIMDEATSALDNTTEAAVIEAVAALKGDRTVIMVAHRLSTVRRCDRIVFLKDGRVDAVGTYDELAREHDDFRTMSEA